MPDYRRTQIGWTTVGAFAIVAACLVGWLAIEGPTTWLFLFLAGMVPAAMFGILTVTITADTVDVRFGLGLIRRRIPLATVRGYARVRNPWYYGWGIHLIPGGMVYNVSGFDAVELSLVDGRRVRIGTDEPDQLIGALRSRAGSLASVAAEDIESKNRLPPLGLLVIPLIVLPLVGFMLYSSTRPIAVTVTAQQVSIDGGTYSYRIDRTDIVSTTLEPTLPAIQRRTNGVAFRGTLRGSFRLRDLGDARLFVERDRPPYMEVRTRRGLVLIGFKDPDRTRALYAELTGSSPPR